MYEGMIEWIDSVVKLFEDVTTYEGMIEWIDSVVKLREDMKVAKEALENAYKSAPSPSSIKSINDMIHTLCAMDFGVEIQLNAIKEVCIINNKEVREDINRLTLTFSPDRKGEGKFLGDITTYEEIEEWIDGINKFREDLKIAIDALENAYNSAISPNGIEFIGKMLCDVGMLDCGYEGVLNAHKLWVNGDL